MFYKPLPRCTTSNVRFSNSLERKTLSSIQFTRPLNQIEQTKNIRIEKNQMFSLNVSRKTSGTRLECIIFERVRLSLAIERSGTLYRKTRVEQNRAADQA